MTKMCKIKLMKIKKGQKLNIELPTSDGKLFNLNETQGKKVLLTFYRIASCSLCNLRISQITKRWNEFGSNFQHVSIWHAPQDFLKNNMDKHNIPFIALADENYKYFNKYSVERSIVKTLLAFVFRLHSFFLAALKGFIPLQLKGYMDIVITDVLIDESGKVVDVQYGRDIGHHYSFDKIKKFSLN